MQNRINVATAPKTGTFQMRINPEVRQEVEAVYASYGLSLTAHEPFTSAEDAVETERDIVSNRVAVRYNPRRALVGDTDNGKALKERIQELKQLLDAYRKGVIKEKK